MFVFHKDGRHLPISVIVFTDRLHPQMKSRFILKAGRDSPVDGQTDFPGDLMQPVLQVPLGGFLLRKPAIHPCHGSG